MNRSQRKSFIREIKNSLGRFVSLLLISALGVAFFTGLVVTNPNMKLTGDVYLDEQNFMDIRVIGTLGMTDEDVEAISEVEGVEDAEGFYSEDFMVDIDGIEYVLSAWAQTENISREYVLEGRAPERSGECLVDEAFAGRHGIHAGDVITLESGTEDPVEDSLNQNRFTVVGIGHIPYYMAFERDISTIGSGKADGFVVIPGEDLCNDIYTQVLVTVEGASELDCFSDEYEALIDEVQERIESLEGLRCEVRFDDVVVSAREEIADAREELEGALEELEDARVTLADAEAELNSAEAELRDAAAQLRDAEVRLSSAANELASGRAELDAAEEELISGEAEYAEGRAQLDEELAAYAGALSTWGGNLPTRAQYNDAVAQAQAGLAQVNAGKAQLEAQAGTEADLQNAKALLESQRASVQGNIAALEGMIAAETDETVIAALQVQLGQAQAGLAYIDSQLGGVNTALAAYAQLNASELQINEALSGLAALEPAITADEALAAARAQLDAGWASYNSGRAEYQAGVDSYDQGVADYRTGLASYNSGLAAYNSGRTQYEDGMAEYLDGLREYNEEAPDAWDEIHDAEEKLDGVEYPKWYVLDRDTIASFVEYGQDAEGIGKLARVFPVLFFLVAALVALTTMTRMVEEQRIEIGTYKALGYSTGAIMKKYVLYALSATLTGSIVGFLIGEKILPYIIIISYKIMYTGVPGCIIKYRMGTTVLAIVISVGCIVFATVAATIRACKSVPATLMRPAAPSAGKRILLERIGFIWKHLRFSLKSAFRNIFRYKKRLFMTIFGIGASMGLMLVGFGIKDSINAIVDNQYRDIWKYDISIDVNADASEYEVYELDRYLSGSGDYQGYLAVQEEAVDFEGGGRTLTGSIMVPETHEDFREFIDLRTMGDKEPLDINDGVIITEKMSRIMGLEAGDTITIVIDGDRVQATIAGVAENYMYHYAYMTPEEYEHITGEASEPNKIYTLLAGETAEVRNVVGEELLEYGAVNSVSFIEDMYSLVSTMIGVLDLVVWVLIISSGMLAFVVLYNLNNISITERRRELATLKVLGFRNTEVAMYIFRENVFLTIIGLVLGVFIGKFLHRYVITTVEIDAMLFGRSIYLPSYIYSILITFAFAIIVNAAMVFKLKKIDMVESLKSME